MNDRSNKGKEFFRTSEYNAIPEYNPKRSIASVDDSVTSLDFDESTHRKNGYSSPLKRVPVKARIAKSKPAAKTSPAKSAPKTKKKK